MSLRSLDVETLVSNASPSTPEGRNAINLLSRTMSRHPDLEDAALEALRNAFSTACINSERLRVVEVCDRLLRRRFTEDQARLFLDLALGIMKETPDTSSASMSQLQQNKTAVVATGSLGHVFSSAAEESMSTGAHVLFSLCGNIIERCVRLSPHLANESLASALVEEATKRSGDSRTIRALEDLVEICAKVVPGSMDTVENVFYSPVFLARNYLSTNNYARWKAGACIAKSNPPSPQAETGIDHFRTEARRDEREYRRDWKIIKNVIVISNDSKVLALDSCSMLSNCLVGANWNGFLLGMGISSTADIKVLAPDDARLTQERHPDTIFITHDVHKNGEPLRAAQRLGAQVIMTIEKTRPEDLTADPNYELRPNATGWPVLTRRESPPSPGPRITTKNSSLERRRMGPPRPVSPIRRSGKCGPKARRHLAAFSR